MAAVKHRDGQQVQHPKLRLTNASIERKAMPPALAAWPANLGDGQRPADIIQGRFAHQHAAQHAQRQQRHIPGFSNAAPSAARRPVTYHDLQVTGEVFRYIGESADKADRLCSTMTAFALTAGVISKTCSLPSRSMRILNGLVLGAVRSYRASDCQSGNRLTFGGEKMITGLQARLLGRAAGHDLANHGR
jgi:hypothetical protein